MQVGGLAGEDWVQWSKTLEQSGIRSGNLRRRWLADDEPSSDVRCMENCTTSVTNHD